MYRVLILTLCLKHCPCLSYAKLLIVKIFLSTLLTYKNWKNDKKFSFNKLVFCRFLPHLRYCALGAPVLEKIFTIGQNRPFLAYQSYFIDLYWHYGAEGAVFIKIACLSGKICNFDAFLRENSPFWSSSLKIWGGGTLIQVVIIILMINVSEFIIGYLLTLCLKHCPCLSYAKLLIVKIFLSTVPQMG